MIEPINPPPADLFEQAVAALRSTTVPAGPPNDVVTATTDALKEADNAPAPNRQSRRSKTMFRTVTACSVAVAAALLLTLGFRLGWLRKNEPVVNRPSVDLEIDGTAFQIEGPFTHQDLSVFLLCSDHQDNQNFLTLDEGLKDGLVSITEQEHEQVRALLIDNQSDRPLYLQEGERLVGGKQDRTIVSSLVIPPKSGKTSVPTFCVEHSRWTEGEKGKKFGFSVNPALAPKGVRGAAKVEGSQDRVWGCVAAQKVSASKTLHCPNTNSSVNEMLDAPQVQSISEEYASAMGRTLERAESSNAVGMAIVFNGQIEEVDLYPNRALFRKLFPRLIRAYAVQAALLKDQAKKIETVTQAAVVQFVQANNAKSQKKNTLDAHNDVQVCELPNNRFQCTTLYDGQAIHWQVMAKNRLGDTAGGAVLGSDW